MFERYTEPARRALFFARYEVSRMGGTVIDTEHLVLGVMRESVGIPGRLSDRSTIGGVTQFATQFEFRALPLARKLLILNIRRDVRVVEGARLESVFVDTQTVDVA